MRTDQPARLGTMDHLRLSVSDISAAKRFYAPLMAFLGYLLEEDEDDRLRFTARTPFGIRHFILTAARPGATPHDRYAPGLHHFAWSADSRAQVDALHDLLAANGAPILDAPAEYGYEPGYYAVFFADPDGFKLELAHVPLPDAAPA